MTKDMGPTLRGLCCGCEAWDIGVAPQASLVAVKVLDQDANGHISDLIRGMQWVYEHRLSGWPI